MYAKCLHFASVLHTFLLLFSDWNIANMLSFCVLVCFKLFVLEKWQFIDQIAVNVIFSYEKLFICNKFNVYLHVNFGVKQLVLIGIVKLYKSFA